MNKETINQIKEQLIIKKQEIEKELSKFAKKNPDKQDDYQTKFPNYGDEEEQNIAEVETFVNNLSLEQNLEKELQNINQALARIDEGKYGQCMKCNQSINPERLKVRPMAVMCIDCQREAK